MDYDRYLFSIVAFRVLPLEKMELRKEQAQRLKETMTRRKEEKLKNKEEEFLNAYSKPIPEKPIFEDKVDDKIKSSTSPLTISTSDVP